VVGPTNFRPRLRNSLESLSDAGVVDRLWGSASPLFASHRQKNAEQRAWGLSQFARGDVVNDGLDLSAMSDKPSKAAQRFSRLARVVRQLNPD